MRSYVRSGKKSQWPQRKRQHRSLGLPPIPAVCVSGGSDGMLVPCQEKRYQGQTKAELDETKARCWKILWSVTVQCREGNVHREAHETTFCTSGLLHSLPINTLGPSSLLWLLLLTPYCLNCFRVQKKS